MLITSRTFVPLVLMVPAAFGTLAAQQGGSVEFGGFGRYTHFDQTLQFSHEAGAGGRLGIFLVKHLELEGAGGYTRTQTPLGQSVDYFPIYARLVYNAPLFGGFSFMLGAGYVHNEYRGDVQGADNGANGLAGFRVFLHNTISLRAEWVGDYTPRPTNGSQGATKNLNLGGQIGLSIHLGNYPPARRPQQRTERDTDRDGVSDGLDACPGTPNGWAVDRVGCPVPADRDGDGVVDADDRCPNTAPGSKVDALGCSTKPEPDADRDGIPDAADACSDTPSGTRVDSAGCPVLSDSDNDGVIDTADSCPNTPRGTTVDGKGCPLDSDRDNVPDHLDRCPSTPPGAAVNAEGCPTLFPLDGRSSIVLEGVGFASGSALLNSTAMAVLDWVAQSLMTNPDVRVEIAGHTDNSGTRITNTLLSQRRADAVRDYLIRRGVPADRLIARGYGPDIPIESNATVAGRAKNRRVELRRLN